MKANWGEILKDRLPLYGHRNWIVVVDSAYPAQSKAGIETIVADEEQTRVLDRARAILSEAKHISATVYTDRELAFVCEEDAPGVGSYREGLGSLLQGFEVRTLPHDEIISKLDGVADKFRILLIKSNMRIPYTSVFFELECGYWNAEAEKRLRAAMASSNGRSKASSVRGTSIRKTAVRTTRV